MATLFERRIASATPPGDAAVQATRSPLLSNGSSPALQLSNMPSPALSGVPSALLPDTAATTSSSAYSSPSSSGAPRASPLNGMAVPYLMMTRNESSSSSFSRQSSVRSTTSVVAVPIRTPARTPIHSPALSRTGSSYGYSPFVPDLAGLPDIAGSPNRSPAPLPPTALPLHIEPHPPVEEGYEMSVSPDGSTLPGSVRSSYTSWPSSPPVTPGLRPPRPLLGPGQELSRTVSSQSITGQQRRSHADFENYVELGAGSYSKVFAVTDRTPPHRRYALKVLSKAHILKEKKEKYVKVEKDALNRLGRHPGIVRIYWTFHDEGHLYFVLELAEQGELLGFMRRFGSVDTESARFYCAQLVSAVEHMHSKGVIHRDLKPENILLDANMRIKVTDYGTAKLLDLNSETPPELQRGNSFVGTAEYVSPEVLQSKQSYMSSDVWAIGVCLVQMLTGRHPFKGLSEYLTFKKITEVEYTLPPDFPADAADLVRSILVYEHTARPTIEQIKRHPFFAPIDWATLWTCPPPPIRTGLSPPPPPIQPNDPRLQHLEGLDYIDDDLDDGDAINNGYLPPAVPGLRPSGASMSSRSSGQSSSGAANAGGLSPNGINNTRSASPRPRSRLADACFPNSVGHHRGSTTTNETVGTNNARSGASSSGGGWSSALRDDELVVYSSPVVDRSRGVLFPTKRRTLVLTDGNRLLSIKENNRRDRVKVKSSVVLGRDDGESEAMIQVVDEDGSRGFKVVTSMRTYRYEDPNGDPGRWVRELRSAHDAGRERVSAYVSPV